VGSRPSRVLHGQDLGQVHHADAGARVAQAAADVHQAGVVGGGADVGAGVDDPPQLVGQHRRRRVGVLDREGAAEAAALLGGRQLDEVDAAHRAQEPDRRVAHLEQPQRVARRVIGHAVMEGRADVLHPEAPDEELGELEDARGEIADLRGERLVAGLGGHPLVALAHHRRARPAGRDDRLGGAEHANEAPHEPDRLVPVARVGVHLTAARLLEREVDLDTHALEHGHRGAPGLGEQRVVEAGDEERRPHTRIMPDALA
jgi:hypothetical protein